MKYFLHFSIVVIFILISCFPKVNTNVIFAQSIVPNGLVVIIKAEDFFPTGKAILIGNIIAGDTGFSRHCNYDEVIINLKAQAKAKGGNILRITEHVLPDGKWSNCDKIKATIYKVDNPNLYEKQIEWSAKRKLTWDDFKGKPNNQSEHAAKTYSKHTLTYQKYMQDKCEKN